MRFSAFPPSFTLKSPGSLLLALACMSPLALSSAPALAQSGTPAPMQPLKGHDGRVEQVMQAMRASKSPTWVSISPDGATVAWTLRDGGNSQIHLTQVAQPAESKVLNVGAESGCSSEAPVWSPDGASLAFVSNCTGQMEKSARPQQQQVFVWSKANGVSKQLTHLTGNINSLAWSPDGKTIAFLFVENATRNAGALAAMKPWSGVIGEDGVEIQRVAAVDTASASFAPLTPANLHVYEFDWSPDAKRLAYVAANPPGENNWWVAQLYTQAVQRPGSQRSEVSAPRSVLNTTTISGPLHGLQIAVPRWSPDGSRIAFIGGLMSDQGSTGGDIYLLPADGGEPKNATPDRAASPVWFKWQDANTLGINEEVRGKNHLFLYDLATGKDSSEYSLTLDQSVHAGGLKGAIATSTENIAFIRSSFSEPPEVWAGPLGDLKQITHLNDGVKPVWGKDRSIEWKNGGYNVQGWLLYPANYDPAKKYPLLVSVHGGPSASIDSSWGGGGALFSAMGYFVFSPNPRGSYGQGERFTQANVKDFGYGDLRDILAGMDVLEKQFPIDKNREGLTGWSYGGFMTMFGVTQTTRFKAAVAGAGISDWRSYYGENSIDQWMLPFFGNTVYDDPAIYAKSSALDYIKQVKTPTLVMVGDRDGECPAPQSFEFWHALRAEGVKTQLVIYPNEGHGFVDPEHIRDRNERMLNWFATQMPAE
ncbi:MAG TPA: S9 family peptidase [Granulicella sp.]|jgi:dipeptidyl aminopeptidase/acylaminoacyl peptidase|nr:S9 family peptidase [Granulicella sp.]